MEAYDRKQRTISDKCVARDNSDMDKRKTKVNINRRLQTTAGQIFPLMSSLEHNYMHSVTHQRLVSEVYLLGTRQLRERESRTVPAR